MVNCVEEMDRVGSVVLDISCERGMERDTVRPFNGEKETSWPKNAGCFVQERLVVEKLVNVSMKAWNVD